MMKISCVFAGLLLAAFASPVFSQGTNEAEFKEYAKMMEGHWRCNVTVAKDFPGVAKKGEKKEVHAENSVAMGGHALTGKSSDGQVSAVVLSYYDREKKLIRDTFVFSSGTVISSVTIKKQDGQWVREMTIVGPDGAKTEARSVLTVSDDGNAHTWTQDGVSNIWRRTKK
jgi:hypothetical protein